MTPPAKAEPSARASVQQGPGRDWLNLHAATWTRSFISHPSRVVAALAITGALAILSVLPMRHWPRSTLIVLLVAAGAAAVNAGLRLAIGERLPPWSLHVDIGSANLFVSVAVAASATEHVDLANLYLMVASYAALYLPLRATLVHLGAAGVAYAVVLAFVSRPADPPVVAWLSVFGTAVVIGAVVLGLVSVLRSASRTDPLTGLANRRMWDERLEEELGRAARNGAALSVVIVDLDGFKAVNDAHGHEAGDRLLQDLARTWQAAFRHGGDFLARLGGDEFGLLAPGADELAARSIARRIAESTPEKVSVSVGVATWDRVEGASDLVRRADQVMYEAKRRHRRAEGRHPA